MSSPMNRGTIAGGLALPRDVARHPIVVSACLAAIMCCPLIARAQSAVDGFNPGANGLVYAQAVQADGKILVGGNFTTLGGGGTGTATRHNIGRLNTDGSLDASFDPGANGYVEALAVQADGKILVGGQFTKLGGGGTGTATRNYLGRLNADGSLDMSFNPGANSLGVKALAVQANGKILVGGRFTMLGGGTGTTARNYIGQLNADGSLDASFDPGANNDVLALAVASDGSILVGGTFTRLGGGGTGTAIRNNLGRLTTDGTLDASFNPGANDQVYAVATQPDGKVVIGGRFTALGGGTGTTPINKLGRLNTNGSVDAGFNPGTDSDVLAVVVQPDGKILIGGTLTMLGGGGTGTTARNAIGRLNGDGSLDASFNPGASGGVYALVMQADAKILVGGLFAGLGGGSGTTPRNNIGRLYADGSVDADFDPGASFGAVVALAVQADGKILVGGGFDGLGGKPRNRVGRLNTDGSLDVTFNPGANGQVNVLTVQPDGKILVGSDGSLGRLNADGSVDMGFNPGASGFVKAVAVQADGKILVGGLFNSLGGVTRNYLGRLNTNGSLDVSFDPGANGTVWAVAVQPDGKILVGGSFTSLGGGGTGATTRNSIGRLNADGSLDASFNPGANGQVNVLMLQQEGTILVGGAFTTLGGGGTGTSTRKAIGRLNPDGSLDASFNPGANGEVHAIAVQADGTILVGGLFGQLGGAGAGTPSNLGRLHSDGSVDLSFNPGTSFIVYALAVQADGKVLVGGGFTSFNDGAGTTMRNNIARLTNTGAAVQRLNVTGGGNVVTWSRSGAGPEVWRATFESSTDGTTYAPLGSATRVAGGWRLSGQSLATQQNLFIRARGHYTTGQSNGSGSIVESIRNAYVPGTCPTITVSPASLPSGTAGIAYSQSITQSGGAGATTTLAVTSGALPPGVDLSTTGVLTGTPTGTGAFNFTIAATDGNGCSGSTAYTLNISPRPPLTIATQPQSLTIVMGQTATLSVSATGLGTLMYQWYQGSTGTTTNPIPGATTSSYTTPALVSTTSYWVRVSNPYSDTADSATATITTVPPVRAQLKAPLLGSTLTGSTVFFQWTSGTGVTEYMLSVGTTAGGVDLYNRDQGTSVNAVVAGLPTTGGQAFVRLWSKIGGAWLFNDYGFTQSMPHAHSIAPVDFDGDGRSDVAVYRPGTATWYMLLSSTNSSIYVGYQWGLSTDIPVPGDFDGDGDADIAVYRPSNGAWYVLLSSTGYTAYVSYAWGLTGDLPVPGDYDGDGKTDIAVYRPSNGSWYILQSSTGYTTYVSFQWGLAGDTPVPADFDGDGKNDIAVYRPSNGGWYVLRSSTNYTTYGSYLWGLAGDVPVPADYDGDGKSDVAVYRPSDGGWYILQSSTGYTTYVTYRWGLAGDIPVPGDYDGDRKTDVAVYRPSSGGWYILQSSTSYTTYLSYLWGLGGDIAVLGRN